MYNAIIFKDKGVLWLTVEETTLVNHALLNGERFFQVERMKQIYNSDNVNYVGVPDLFNDSCLDEKTTFGWTDETIFAHTSKSYLKYDRRSEVWVDSTQAEFEASSDYEGFLK
jgi:hypothetical protein